MGKTRAIFKTSGKWPLLKQALKRYEKMGERAGAPYFTYFGRTLSGPAESDERERINFRTSKGSVGLRKKEFLCYGLFFLR